jgi:hypothetical protein
MALDGLADADLGERLDVTLAEAAARRSGLQSSRTSTSGSAM